MPLRDMVVDEVRRLILDGQLHPGTHLVEDRLAEQLGVSRNPVREAIRVLGAEGFVTLSARRGAFVATLSAIEAQDFFDVRLALEPLGAKLAAKAAGPDGVAQLEEILERARVAMEIGEHSALAELNSEFHARVFQLSGNEYLVCVAVPMVRRGQWLFRQSVARRAPDSWTEHRSLVSAIKAGDAELAEAESRRHVLAARAAFPRS